MQAEPIIDVWQKARNSLEPSTLTELYADNVYYRDPTASGGIHGKERLLKYLAELSHLYPVRHFQVIDCKQIRHGDRLFIRWHAGFGSQLASNNVTEIDGVTRLTVRGNNITREETFYDRLPVAISLVLEMREHRERLLRR